MALTDPFSDCRTLDARIGSVKKNNARAIGPSVSGLIFLTDAVTSNRRRMWRQKSYCTTTSSRAPNCDAQGHLQFLQRVDVIVR
jgi:hypothetical protein